jgi:hypothetical protein
MVDVPGVYQAAFDVEVDPHRLRGLPFNGALRYYGALVIMTLLYGFMVVAMRGKRMCAVALGPRHVGRPSPDTPHL